MKRLVKLILFIFLIIPINIFAAGSITVSTQNINMQIGSTAGFNVNASNAAGRVDISVSDGNIISANNPSFWAENNSTYVSVSGKSVGRATIYVKITDAATFDEEEISGTYVINVNVVPVPEKKVYSNNNKLKSLTIKGYEPTKVDDNNYLLIVNNNITNIEIEAEKEDSKANIIGTGKKDLNIGENKFEIIVTAESGAQNKINVTVMRKEGRYLNELSDALKEKEVSILLKDDDIITNEDLTLIKKAKKTVTFNYYDSNKKLLYSWIIDGKKLNNLTDIKTSIKYESSKRLEIYKVSNYADGKYVSFKHDGKLPSGVRVKLLVNDTFEDKNKVFIYYYNEKDKNLKKVYEKINVKDGFVEYDIDHASDYFISMSNVNTGNVVYKKSSKALVICIIEGVIIIGLGYAFYTKFIGKSRKNEETSSQGD